LKLGYGGTKEEMARLLEDAEKLSGIKYDISSYADIVDAIHVVQTEMGITGTTAKEASSTIQGSLSSMKSAWQNLTVGIADENANIDVLIDNFVNSVVTVGDNLLPRIEKILGGIGTLVQKLAPKIAAALPQLVNTILPPMVQAGISMVGSLIEGIRQNLDALATGAVEIIMMLLEALGGMLPDLIMMGVELVIALIDGIASKPDTLVKTAITLISTLCRGLLQALPEIVRAATDLMAGLISSIIMHLPEILMTGIQIVLELVGGAGEALHEVLQLGRKIVQNIIDGIASAWGNLVSWFSGLWDSLFGNRQVNVHVNKTSSGDVDGSHANGLDYVPFNGYIAELHKGEMVVPAAEAQMMRMGQLAYAGAAQPINIPITLELDGSVLARKMYSYNQTESARHGKSFVR
jgi:phage-related protein